MTKKYDTIIVGAGPAGLSLALGLARSNKDVAVIERGLYGGTLNDTEYIENVLGIPKTSGMELAQTMYDQVKDFDNITYINETVELLSNGGLVGTNKDEYLAKTVAIATGVRYKELGVPGEEEYRMNVSNCATCDKMFYKDKHVVMVGGGDSAYEGAIELADVAKTVSLFYYKGEDQLRAEPILQDRFNTRINTRAYFNSNVTEIVGENGLANGVKYTDEEGNKRLLNADGVFVNVGVEPNTDFLPNEILTDKGYIKVWSHKTFQIRDEHTTGGYALGDVVDGNEKQVAKAMGDATVVTREINKYLDSL